MSTVCNFIAFLAFNKFFRAENKIFIFISEDDRKLLVTRMTTELGKGENTW